MVQTWVRCVKMDGFVLIRSAGPDRMYKSLSLQHDYGRDLYTNNIILFPIEDV